VKEFYNDNNVAFGDVNLATDQIRGNHNPGAGGWPTIKYFNQETGYQGAAYEKKTSKSMCDELGDSEYMRAYIKDKSPSCSVDDTSSGCSDKEVDFISKWKSKDSSAVAKELGRLENMRSAKLTADLLKWQLQRLRILKQLQKKLETLQQMEGKKEL
jgi:hypothetical protein